MKNIIIIKEEGVVTDILLRIDSCLFKIMNDTISEVSFDYLRHKDIETYDLNNQEDYRFISDKLPIRMLIKKAGEYIANKYSPDYQFIRVDGISYIYHIKTDIAYNISSLQSYYPEEKKHNLEFLKNIKCFSGIHISKISKKDLESILLKNDGFIRMKLSPNGLNFKFDKEKRQKARSAEFRMERDIEKRLRDEQAEMFKPVSGKAV